MFAQPTNATSLVYEASRIIYAKPGRLLCVNVYNSGGAQFIQLHDATALPANAVVPVAVFAIGATSNLLITFGQDGRQFDNGIVICNSSTGPAKTLGGADCFFDAQFA